MSTPLVLAIVLALVIPVQLFRAHRLHEAFVEDWARERGLALTPENRPMVVRHLRSARVWRTWGAVAGAVLPSVIELAWSGRVQVLGFGADGNSAPLAFGTIYIGYLVGALGAELALSRPATGLRRTASLARRELEQYLPRRVVLVQRGVSAAGALGAIAVGVVPYPDSVSDPGLAAFAIAAVVVLAFGAGLEAVERWLVRRPQPLTSPSVVAADDALRARSIHAVAGAGLALLLLFCGGVALVLQASDVPVLRSTMALPAAACLILSLLSCVKLGEAAWRVRRPVGATGAAST